MSSAGSIDLEEVIEAIYGAVYDPGQWPEVVARYARAVATEKASLYGGVLNGDWGRIFVSQGFDPTPVIDKFPLYGHLSPIADRAVELGMVPGVFINSDVIPDKAYRKTPYYQEFAHPSGCDQGLQAILRAGGDGGRRVVMNVARSDNEPLFGETELAVARALFPHLRRAVTLTLEVNPGRSLDPAVQDALDGFDTPCCLLGVGGRLVFANAAAREMLAAGDAIRSAGRGVSAAYSGARAALETAIGAACDDAARWTLRGAAEVVLPREDGPPVIGVIVPLGPNNPFLHVGPLRAAVYLLDPSTHQANAPELARLREVFALTQAEAEVTGALIEGLTPAEIAAQRKVSLHTVRTQIKLVLEKTQSAGQVDLLRLQRLFALRFPDRR